MTKNKTIYEVKQNKGVYVFKLYDLLSKANISHNKFMRDTSTEYGTMKRYAIGSIQKVDLVVLDRWCDYLNCSFEDIIEYRR